MSEDKIVQFVSFETILDTEQFISKWQEYTRSGNSDHDVTMQQSVKENGFRYITQHRCDAGELEFIFEKTRRSSRIREVEIIAKLAGGYSVLQAERMNDTRKDERKVFAFLTDPTADLAIYRQLYSNSKLNVYQAYYENCRYAYILEFFVKNESASELQELLKKNNVAETGIYKECILQLS